MDGIPKIQQYVEQGAVVDADHAGLSFNDAVQMAQMASLQDMSYAPGAMQPLIQQCLQTLPGPRPTVMDYLACEFFHDMQAKCLQFLEAFPEKDKATKAQFLKQLTTHLESFERRVLQQKVIAINYYHIWTVFLKQNNDGPPAEGGGGALCVCLMTFPV